MASAPSALVPSSSFAPEMRRQLAVLPLRPGLTFFSGHAQSSRLSHYFLAAPLLRGEAVLFLDAANCFDPYRIVALAQKWRRSPPELLRRVRVSRAFTCFQMAELIQRTARAARRYGAQCIVLTGFPDIFDDEEISPAEAKSVFTRALGVLRGWRALTALAFSDLSPQPTPLRAWLMRQLARDATAVYRLEETATGLALRLVCHAERSEASQVKSRSLDCVPTAVGTPLGMTNVVR
ncbi:MAG TPA: hypothetical protein VLB32_09075 [Candidatus Acidoferrales bacterium]|nr:hypothetical protein [Candidatus Acidoferrales bacterium]